jgi:hypothetical protein
MSEKEDHDLSEICEGRECELLIGNVVDIEVKKDDCEVRADIVVAKKHCVRIWGQVLDCEGNPVQDALIKLARRECAGEKSKLVGVAHAVSDCKGFYQFEVCGEDIKQSFRIIVGKAAVGKERHLPVKGKCKPCCPHEDD